MDPPIAPPDTRSPCSSPELDELGGYPSKNLKRKDPEPSKSPRLSQHKRRKYSSSDMVVQAEGSFTERHDGAEDGEENTWVPDSLEVVSLKAGVRNYKRKAQDAFLKFLKEEELRKKAESALNREKYYHVMDNAAWKDEVREAKQELRQAKAEIWQSKEELRKERNERIRRERDRPAIKDLQTEIEHLTDINATITSDLDELRVVENEAATKRRDEHIGLPPAYGNLNDEERFPPYSAHSDGGTIEVAHLKRATRQRFDAIVSKALISGAEKRSKLELFGTLASGLYEATDSLQKLLDIAPKVPVSRVRKPGDYADYNRLLSWSLARSVRIEGSSPAKTTLERNHPQTTDRTLQGPSRTHLPGYALIQEDKSAPYVADRIAKLLLELSWRFATACVIRPGAGTYPSVERSSTLLVLIMLQFAHVDSVLTKALQLAFSQRKSMAPLQYHLTQLEHLNVILKSELYAHGVDRQFFTKAIEWLSDQVEKERASALTEDIMAFRAAHPEVFGGGGAALQEEDGDDDDDGDGVSSRWQGSEIGSGEDEAENAESGGGV